MSKRKKQPPYDPGLFGLVALRNSRSEDSNELENFDSNESVEFDRGNTAFAFSSEDWSAALEGLEGVVTSGSSRLALLNLVRAGRQRDMEEEACASYFGLSKKHSASEVDSLPAGDSQSSYDSFEYWGHLDAYHFSSFSTSEAEQYLNYPLEQVEGAVCSESRRREFELEPFSDDSIAVEPLLDESVVLDTSSLLASVVFPTEQRELEHLESPGDVPRRSAVSLPPALAEAIKAGLQGEAQGKANELYCSSSATFLAQEQKQVSDCDSLQSVAFELGEATNRSFSSHKELASSEPVLSLASDANRSPLSNNLSAPARFFDDVGDSSDEGNSFVSQGEENALNAFQPTKHEAFAAVEQMTSEQQTWYVDVFHREIVDREPCEHLEHVKSRTHKALHPAVEEERIPPPSRECSRVSRLEPEGLLVWHKEHPNLLEKESALERKEATEALGLDELVSHVGLPNENTVLLVWLLLFFVGALAVFLWRVF